MEHISIPGALMESRMKCQIEKPLLLQLPFLPFCFSEYLHDCRRCFFWDLPWLPNMGGTWRKGMYFTKVELKLNTLPINNYIYICYPKMRLVVLVGALTIYIYISCFRPYLYSKPYDSCICRPNTVDLRMTRGPLVFGGWCLASACILLTMWPC